LSGSFPNISSKAGLRSFKDGTLSGGSSVPLSIYSISPMIGVETSTPAEEIVSGVVISLEGIGDSLKGIWVDSL